MEVFLRLGGLFLVALVSAATTYVAVNPKQDLNASQQAVMQEYLSAYCAPDMRHEPQYLIGQAAVLSRVIMKANLGTVALAEYAKCKVGG